MINPIAIANMTGKQRGVSLIEVLITVFILASGLLGMAALQGRSLSYNNIAYLNTQASIIAYDMLDRIKSNTTYSIDGTGYEESAGGAPVSYPTTCSVGNCTPSELATYDIAQWKFIIDRQLPDGDGSIQKTDTTEGRIYTITVFFDDSRGRETSKEVIIRSML